MNTRCEKHHFCLVLVNAIAASSRNDRIISRAFLILHEQPNQQCKIDLSTTTKIPEFFCLYDRGM